MTRHAFVTLVTNDGYLMGAQALLYSLASLHRVGPGGEGGEASYAAVVLCTPEVTPLARKRLQKMATEVKVVEGIPLPLDEQRLAEDRPWAGSAYSKLRVWELEEYDKVLYLDADCVVLQPLDELFERPIESAALPLAAAPDCFPPDRFNAGVMLLLPSRDTFQRLVSFSGNVRSYDGGDTGLLNAFFSDWFRAEEVCRLPFRFNAQRTMYWMTYERNPGYWKACEPICVLHYSSSPKPWQSPDRKGDLEIQWWEIYTMSQLATFR